MHRSRERGVTIEDVARAAGVSRQTVSNALNAPYRLKPETLEKVTALVEEMGYRPDQSARSLRSGTRRVIAYTTPEDDPTNPNPLMSGFLESLVAAAGEIGYRILLVRPRPGQDQAQAIDEVIAARTVDGFMVADVLHGDPRVARLAERGFPFAAFGKTDAGLPQSWVDVDTAQAMIDLVGLLAGRGHHRIAYLGPASGLPWMDDRLEGFHAGVRRFNLNVSPAMEVTSPSDDPAEITRIVRGLLRDHRPSAIVAAGDWLAMGAYAAARQEGLTVGADLAVTGFNDLPVTAFLRPALTTVRLPLRRIADALVSRLLQIIDTGTVPQAGLLLPGELVVRDSTGG